MKLGIGAHARGKILQFLPTILVMLCCAITGGSAQAQSAAAVEVSSAPADTIPAVPKRDVGDVIGGILHKEPKPEPEGGPRQGLSKALLPSLGYNPVSGAFVGVSVALGGWLGDPKTTQLSAGSISGTYSTEGQVSVQFKSDFFLPENEWALKGDWRYLDTSQPTYGLGPATSGQTPYPMDFALYRIYQTVYRRVKTSNYYVGLGYHFDRYDKIFDERAAAGDSTPYSIYSGGTPSRSTSSGLSVNVLADTRDNPINAHRGVYWNFSMRFFMDALGADDTHETMWSDFRAFVPDVAGKGNVLAIWNTMWFTFGETPYLALPASGWDTYGRGARGFVQGRIRGSNQTYTEFEYRKRLTRDGLLGAVGFINLLSTTYPDGGRFGPPDFGGGAGLRLKFNKRTDTNLAVDAGYGQDDSFRMFFGLQEVF